MSSKDFADKENMEAGRELPDEDLEAVAGGKRDGRLPSYLGDPCPKCGQKTVLYEGHMFFCDTCNYGASYI